MEQLLLLNLQEADQVASGALSAAVQHLLRCWTALLSCWTELWVMAGTPTPLMPATAAMPFAHLTLEQVQKCIALLPSDAAAEAAVALCALLSDSASVKTGAGSYGSNTNIIRIRDL